MMNLAARVRTHPFLTIATHRQGYWIQSFVAGLLIPLGFAPFHTPGFSIIGLVLLFLTLERQSFKNAFYPGFIFGLGMFGLGISWIYVSIHEYGHLNCICSVFITCLLAVYLSLFLGGVTWAYKKLIVRLSTFYSAVLFSTLWALGEFIRSNLFGGFPWLQLGFGQMDTPLRYLLPIIGLYGVGFMVCLSAASLAISITITSWRRYLWISAFAGLLTAPNLLAYYPWANTSKASIPVGIIQANLSMRDKWDETLFWTLIKQYQTATLQLLKPHQLIVMPESAIPIPASYISEFLESLHSKATEVKASLLFGIPEPTSTAGDYFYNTISSLGSSNGSYKKQHLVPFGEFIPPPFHALVDWLGIPAPNLKPGRNNQALLTVLNYPIATLICYELAFPHLLRSQLPAAAWIVSISDDGWFGHSLAMYQQLQMAQALSMQTARFQVMANNDGLSSIINATGDIVTTLPAFTKGTLQGTLHPATGITPWVRFGDTPIILFFLVILALGIKNKITDFKRPNSCCQP